MNISLNENYERVNDLCDQIFDYFHLTFYDLEGIINDNLSIEAIKDKLDTFSDRHFSSALKDFNLEIQNLKNKFPNELIQLEELSFEIKENFNKLLSNKVFDKNMIIDLKRRFKENLSKIKLS
jgi:hypothetical protein